MRVELAIERLQFDAQRPDLLGGSGADNLASSACFRVCSSRIACSSLPRSRFSALSFSVIFLLPEPVWAPALLPRGAP